MTTTQPVVKGLQVERSVDINATIDVVFESLLEELGPGSESPEGPMPMTLEAWPGGRWYRDLGDNRGHFWGHVQVIKPPHLLEITGPLFMSYAAVSHVQYRLEQQNGGTLLRFVHRAVGTIDPEHRAGVTQGWDHEFARVKKRAEEARGR